jgi:hypothetical protein
MRHRSAACPPQSLGSARGARVREYLMPGARLNATEAQLIGLAEPVVLPGQVYTAR